MPVPSITIHRVLFALAAAGYPPPRLQTHDGYTTLLWGAAGGTSPAAAQVTVFNCGPVVVTVNQFPEASVNVDYIDAWLAVLHPAMANLLTTTACVDPIPAPPLLPFGSLPEFAYLDDTTRHGSYAVFADQSRLRVSAADSHTAIAALIGTLTGYQLGITLGTVVAAPTTTGAVYLNPAAVHPAATPSSGGFDPAVALPDGTRHTLRPTGPATTSSADLAYRTSHAAATYRNAATILRATLITQQRTGTIHRL